MTFLSNRDIRRPRRAATSLIRAGCPGGGQAPCGLPVIPSPAAVAGMMGCAVLWPARSIEGVRPGANGQWSLAGQEVPVAGTVTAAVTRGVALRTAWYADSSTGS